MTILPEPNRRASKPAARKAAEKNAPRPAAKVATRSAQAQTPERINDILKRLVNLKAARPGTVKTLRSTLMSWFKPPLTEAELDTALAQLAKAGKIKITGTKVAYALG